MIQSINQLENQRINKIKDLTLEETKAYIKSLNKKRIGLLNNPNEDLIDFYDEKLKEVFDLTEDKFQYLDYYSLNNRLDLTNVKLLECNLRRHIQEVSYVSLMLNNSYLSLKCDLTALNNIGSENHEAIDNLKTSLKLTIQLLAPVESRFNETEIKQQLKEIDYEKEYVQRKADTSEGINLLKSSDYIDLLDIFKDSFLSLLEILEDYTEIKSEVIDFIASDERSDEVN